MNGLQTSFDRENFWLSAGLWLWEYFSYDFYGSKNSNKDTLLYSLKVKQSENSNFLVVWSNYRLRYFKILNFQRIFNQSLWKNFLKNFFGKKYSNIEKSEVFRVSFEVKLKWRDATCIYYHISVFWSNWNLL